MLDAEVHEQARVTDPFVVLNVELGLSERRGTLILHDLYTGPVPDDVLAILDRTDTTDVETHGGVEFQRSPTRRRLRAPEHDPDLLADLVGEYDRRLRAVDRPGQLPERLAHEAGLKADVRITHLALDFGAWDERGNRVDDHDVDGVATNQDLRNLERLLACIRLRDEKIIDIDAELPGVLDIECVLRVK